VLAGWGRDFGFMMGGASFAFGSTQIGSDNGTDSRQTNSYQGTLYGTSRFGMVFVDGQLGYTRSDHNTSRQITVGPLVRQASGNPDGNDFTLVVRGGVPFLVDRFRVEPSVGLDWYNINRSAFSESGAGSAGLAVNGATLNAVSPSLGAKIATNLALDDVVLVPQLEARWYDNVGDRSAPVVASLTGAATTPFATATATPGRSSAVIGASLTANAANSLQFYLAAEGQLAAHLNQETLSAGIRYIW